MNEKNNNNNKYFAMTVISCSSLSFEFYLSQDKFAKIFGGVEMKEKKNEKATKTIDNGGWKGISRNKS